MSEYLRRRRILMDKENASAAVDKNVLKGPDLNPSLVFPSEFPYEFDLVLGSTETETTSVEEDFLAGLTQRLTHSSTRKREKSWVVASSPESTLSGLCSMSVSSNGSPNGSSSLVSSPPTTPFGGQNDTWGLISAAAGQIARLKMCNSIETANSLLPPPKSTSPVHAIKNPNLGFYTSQSVNFDIAANTNQEQMLKASSLPQQQQIQNKGRNFGHEGARCGQQLPQSAWPPLQVLQHQQKPQQQRTVFVDGSSCVKRECAGTGVFLPRGYGNSNNNPHDFHRKSGSPNVLVPHVQQRFHSSFDATRARRNAVITWEKRSLRAEAARNHNEIQLPKEWTY